MVESLTETLRDAVTLTEAARRFYSPVPHVATVHRHATKGVRGIKLETWFCGGKRVTTEAAVERFFQALNVNCAESDDSLPDADLRRSQEARKALQGLGI